MVSLTFKYSSSGILFVSMFIIATPHSDKYRTAPRLIVLTLVMVMPSAFKYTRCIKCYVSNEINFESDKINTSKLESHFVSKRCMGESHKLI